MKKEVAEASSPVAVDSTSDESDSLNGEAANHGLAKLMKIVKVSEDKFKLCEFEAKVGLNGS